MKKAFVLALLVSVASIPARAAGNIESGKALTAKYNCASCHGKDFNSPIDPSYPKLAGQHVSYLEHALTAYKRAEAANGRNNAIMSAQAKPLSDKDMRDIAAFLHSLPGTLVLQK